MGPSRPYRVQEFAKLAGVTVRALHHYDRLGLLRPRRNGSGYRQYSLADLERLEQIVALKFLGIPLQQIRVLLNRNPLLLPQALRQQRVALEEKRRRLDCAIHAIGEAEKTVRPGEPLAAARLKKIIEVIEMNQNTDWMKKYSSEEAWRKIEKGKLRWSPELQERVSHEWSELFRDVEAVLDADPASPEVQALADRWIKLVEEFTQGDHDVTQSLSNLYNDRANWPQAFQKQMQPYGSAKVWSFMHKVLALRKAR
jgi:DNA-binding transcriptional MerR regulator